MNDHSYLIPTDDDLPHGLGRHVHHDPHNFEPHHLALIQPPARSPIPFPTWYRGAFMLDQGDSPSCTIHAAYGMARTSPFGRTFSAADRARLDTEDELRAAYRASQIYDPPEWGVHDGAASDSPLKWMRAQGMISSYKWLRGEAEVREWVKWFGPCSFGTVWLSSMFYPDSRGWLTVSGSEVGGHEYEIAYYSVKRDAYRVVNSWGYGWGDNGRAWLAASDARDLLAADGDAVTIG